ncbi:hypothetical protein CEXT_61621 [Caerostris extrusa]|uniref:Transposase n=1 Tax=Caerostris extrusa TaxID=172846 RepID=A0AAV4XMV7_CAEEX|nr:hypothetical protein CEXT_61621 [Caerostris extrusa]
MYTTNHKSDSLKIAVKDFFNFNVFESIDHNRRHSVGSSRLVMAVLSAQNWYHSTKKGLLFHKEIQMALDLSQHVDPCEEIS